MPEYKYTDQDNRPDAIPAGDYVGTIIEAEETIAKSSGNPMIQIVWEIDDNHAHIYDYLVFSDKSAWRIDTFLKATGHTPSAKGDTVKIEPDKIIGWRAPLNVGIEDNEYTGKKRNRIIQYITNKGIEVEDLRADKKKTDKDDLPF